MKSSSMEKLGNIVKYKDLVKILKALDKGTSPESPKSQCKINLKNEEKEADYFYEQYEKYKSKYLSSKEKIEALKK